MDRMKFRAVSLNHLDNYTISHIRIWRNQDFVRKNMFQSHIITEEEHKKYINKMKQDSNRDLYVFYLDGNPFGVFQYQIDNRGTISAGSYLVNEKFQSCGYGVIMFYMTIWIQYYIVKAEFFESQIISYNKGAISLHKKYGCDLTKCEHNAYQMDGRYYDILYFTGKVTPPDKSGRIGKVVFDVVDENIEVI